MRYTSRLWIVLLLCLLPDDSYSNASQFDSSLLVLSLATQALYRSHDGQLGDLNQLPLKYRSVNGLPPFETTRGYSTTATRCNGNEFRLTLEKLIIKSDKDGNGTPGPVICSICKTSYASTHTECCHHPVCRNCMLSNSSKDACQLCGNRKCYICLEFKSNIIPARCCSNSICEQCLAKCTQITTSCPYCGQSICDKPTSNRGTLKCPSCALWVSRKGFTDHQLARHPTSEVWIQDYQYCARCKIYIHPQIEAVHLASHRGSYVRGARSHALALILQSTVPEPVLDVDPDCINNAGDEGLGDDLVDDADLPKEDSEECSEEASQLSWVICPVCQQQVNNENLTDHMAAGNHIYSEVDTLWHQYCRSCRLYIRRGWYPIHHQQ